MKRRWLLPVILLVVLFLALGFRWSIEASNTLNPGVVKWEKDRWTGRIWLKVYGPSFRERLVTPPPVEGEDYAKKERAWLTRGWVVATGGTAIWLLVSLRHGGGREHG